MRKKIVFILINMNMGGTEKAFLNLVEEIDRTEYEVDLLLLEKRGEFIEEVPKWIKIKRLNGYEKIKEELNLSPKENIKKYIKKRKFFSALSLGMLYLECKIRKERSKFYKRILKDIYIEEKYDIAIAYAGPMELITYIVSEKIKAKTKYQWIHFDVSKIGINKNFYEKFSKSFNEFVIVSEEGKRKILEAIPSLKKKVVVKNNNIPKLKIKKLADEDEGFNDNFNGIRILTVGRISQEKGYDLAINVCKKLVEDNLNIRWYGIGEGALKEKYIERCKALGIEENFIFLGGKRNPYSFISQCDIYVQPSKYEGFCITIGEAKIFKKRIITTNFTGAKEQFLNYAKGKIVENEKELYEEIKLNMEVKKE